MSPETREILKRAAALVDGDDGEPQPDAAMDLCYGVLKDEPDNPGALFVVGCVLMKAARQVQAIQVAKRITEVAPKDPRGWGMQAQAWAELHRYDESIRCAERAFSLKRNPRTLADMIYAHSNAGNWDKADSYVAECYAKAQEDPEQWRTAISDCNVNKAYIDLAKGRWVEGFKGFRYTMRTKWRKEWTYGDSVEWQGEPDAVVMVTGEQGIGDEVMAASVVPEAASKCKTFILDCDSRLAALFARSFPNVVVTPTRRDRQVTLPVMPTHHKSLFGLCELFRRQDSDFPRQPYIVPNAAYVGMFRELFGGQRTIGLAWSGGLPRTGMEPRAAGVSAFLPLLRRGEAQYVSLQYKQDSPELIELYKNTGIRVLSYPWAAQNPDMDLVAGMIGACDEVIGVGTASMHLAAAMGVPATVLVNRGLGWAWQRPEMLWYPPSINLFHKQQGESWRDCVNRLVEARK